MTTMAEPCDKCGLLDANQCKKCNPEDTLLPCPCGMQAELHEWEEIDAKRWAARAKCNCGWEGPIGYADNRLGCFDAVNSLHKKRAITAWNKRSSALEMRTNVGSDNLSDQDRKAMDDSLKEWTNSPEAAQEALLQTINIMAEAGLCQMTHAGTREFLKDIREIIKEATNG